MSQAVALPLMVVLNHSVVLGGGILPAGEARQTPRATLRMWEERFSIPGVGIEMYTFL